MEKKKPFKKNEAQTENYQRIYVEAKRPRKTKKKRLIKKRRDASSHKNGIHAEPQQTEISRRRLVRVCSKTLKLHRHLGIISVTCGQMGQFSSLAERKMMKFCESNNNTALTSKEFVSNKAKKCAYERNYISNKEG